MGEISNIALDFVDQVTCLDDEAEVRELLLQHGRTLGYDYLIVAELPERGLPTVHLCNWPREYFDFYCKYLYQDDPLARHARRTTEPFVWSEVQWDRSKDSPAQRVIDQSIEFGLEDGFVVPIVSPDGDQSGIGLAGRRTTLKEPDRRALHLMCVYAHHSIQALRRGCHVGSEIVLTATQRDVLTYSFLGRDIEAMHDVLGMSTSAIRQAQIDAYRALGATDALNAACMARLGNAIQP